MRIFSLNELNSHSVGTRCCHKMKLMVNYTTLDISEKSITKVITDFMNTFIDRFISYHGILNKKHIVQ